MNQLSWNRLLRRIADGYCTPFIGAAASLPVLRAAKDIAEDWTAEHGYPLEDSDDLARVAQYLAVSTDPMAPKEMMRDEIHGKGPPDFSDPNEPHVMLADLGLPLCITTNYDDFMLQALRDRGREPVQEICKWNDHGAVQADPAPLGDDPGYVRLLGQRRSVHAGPAREVGGLQWRLSATRSPIFDCPPEKTARLAALPGRLARLDPGLQDELVNWGFAVSDAALRAHFDPRMAPARAFPYPGAGVG